MKSLVVFSLLGLLTAYVSGQSSAVLRIGTSRTNQAPTVIRLQPGSDRFQRFRPRPDTNQPAAPRAVALPTEPFRPPQAPLPPPAPAPIPQPPQPVLAPTQPDVPAPAAQPELPQIPPQLLELLGLNTLGIPGLYNPPSSAAAPVAPAGLPQGLQLPPGFALPPGFQIPPGLLSGAGGAAGGSPNNFGGGLVAPTGGFNPNLPLPAQGFQGYDNTGGGGGLLGLFGSFVKQLSQNAGVRDILNRAQGPEGISVPGLSSIPGFNQLPGLSALYGGGRGPPVAGLPRFKGLNLLQIPRSPDGRVDVIGLLSEIGREVSNGTTLADLLPPAKLQDFADNVTDVLLPDTPELDLDKFMGRWFEGINSPRASEQRCVVHHYGGLTENGKTATFTALKIYREGSEFGQVRYSIGYAFRGGKKDAMLQMHTSEATDPAPFWMYKLGPEGKDAFGNLQYEWAIASNWVKYPVTVLVRDPDTFKAKYEKEVLRWLEDQGFINGFIRAFNLLQPATYKNCQYADSAFEVFGK